MAIGAQPKWVEEVFTLFFDDEEKFNETSKSNKIPLKTYRNFYFYSLIVV